MTIYSGPVFDMAREQFNIIADYLDIPNRRPRPAAVSETRGRGRHPGAHGRRTHRGVPRLPRPAPPHARSDQGRHALLPRSRRRRGRRAGDLDELEMRPRRPALWRREGWRGLRSAGSVQAGAGGGVAPLHAGDDPVRQSADRRDGARHGHQRAGHGLVHGHLFHVPWPRDQRDRHRQAGGARRHRGTAGGDRSRRCASRRPRLRQPAA